MKTTIIELLNKIANGEELPKKIKYADEVLEYDGYKIDYVDSDGDGLFNEYAWITELNDEVEILETTITYKQDSIENSKQDKIEKLKIITKKTECGYNHYYLVNDKIEYRLREVNKIILDKINEIIDYIQKEN